MKIISLDLQICANYYQSTLDLKAANYFITHMKNYNDANNFTFSPVGIRDR